MSVQQEMERRLRAAINIHDIEIIDESEMHRGHAGYREGGESHFSLTVSAPELTGKSRIERHRAIHDALGKDLMGRIHALRITIT